MIDLKIALPKGFLDEEVRCGYTVTNKMKEVWAVEIDLLMEFNRVCEKAGIKYYIDAGSLLGAVREQGFIPWDDDIDLVMFRDEYEKLLTVAQYEFKEPYFFQTPYTEKGYWRGHAQMRNSLTTAIVDNEKGMYTFNQGIFLDIFILDGVHGDCSMVEKQKKEALSVQKKERIMRQGQISLGTKARLLRTFYKVVGKKHIDFYREWENIIKRYSVNECENVAPLGFVFETEKRIRNRHLYDKTVWLPFEFIKVPAPVGYDEFLTRRYGNYMEPAKIPTTHGGMFFDTDKS